MSSHLLDQLKEERIVAILRGIPRNKGTHIARALHDGGIVFTEVTMNTEGAASMISEWREQFGGKMSIGAGTVLDLKTAREAVSAGAEYLVSPHLDEEVIDYARSRGLAVFPGAMTPTEIMKAWKAGATAVKIFPMATMGIGYLKEITAPLDHIPMLVTGGVRLDNIREFLEAGAAGVGIGSHLVHPALVREGRYEQIVQNAKELVQAAKTYSTTAE